MPSNIIVVDRLEHWSAQIPNATIVASADYIRNSSLAKLRKARVYNLSHSYQYQSKGYYVSLLAEARGHIPYPSVVTIQDLKFQSLARSLTGGLQSLIDQALAPLKSDTFVLSVYFGKNFARRYDALARKLAARFPSPLIRASFKKRKGQWKLHDISAITTNDIPTEHWELVYEAAEQFFKRSTNSKSSEKSRFSIAILVDPSETMPPSNEPGLKRFCAAAAKLHIETEIITKDDYGRLSHFDALFIRCTTSVNHFTYRFARAAEGFGMPVIDSSASIVRCANKVYLAELLRDKKITTPKTIVAHRENLDEVLTTIGLPLILKLPDSAFSLGVKKASTDEEFRSITHSMFRESELLIAQEYLPTDFDWRIGVLDRKPYFACKYFMARGHWQIYNNDTQSQKGKEGGFECVPVELVPRHIMSLALKATEVIGDGLYGVDLKEIGAKAVIIEVNDNPNLDAGIEDKLLRESLWERLAETFLHRMEAR